MVRTAPRETRRATLLMSAKEMAKISGIGEGKLRDLMENNKIEYLQIGKHRLLCVKAIWDYYNRNKTDVDE